MYAEEFVLSIIAIVMGTGILIVGISKITDLIKTWINRNKSSMDEEAFNRLAKAFMQHKNEVLERVQNLEAIIASEKGNVTKQIYPEIEEHHKEKVLTNDLRNKKRSQ